MNIFAIWRPVKVQNMSPASNGLLWNQFYSFFDSPLGNQRIIFGGWAGSNTSHPLTPTDILVLEKNSDGKFSDKTDALFKDKSTNGVGDIVVADLNADRVADLFLPSNNEGSLVPYGGVAFLSQGSQYSKVDLPGSSLTHDAALVSKSGQTFIVTGSLGGDHNPIYYFDGTKFVEKFANYSVMGNTVAVIPSATSNQYLTIKGDIGDSYAVDSATGNYSWNRLDIEVYRGDGWSYAAWQPIQKITPYLATLKEYANFQSAYGKGIAHTYRIFNDDLNYDGFQDLLVAQSMWVRTSGGVFPSALQVLINKGNDSFEDRTATLNPDMGLNFDEGDYSLSVSDIDKSGVNSYVFSGGWQTSTSDRWPFFVLLNDGSGKLHVALSNAQTQGLLSQIKSDLSTRPEVRGYQVSTKADGGLIANLYGIASTNGGVDFLAQVQATDQSNKQLVYFFTDTGFHYDPTTSYKESVTIADRNQSPKLRTWAGNDRIYDTHASNLDTSINGGLGTDISIYSDKSSNYSITIYADHAEVRHKQLTAQKNPTDSLISIERLQFTDVSLALDLNASAGQAYRVYKAAFNRDPMIGDRAGLGYWIAQIDKGMDLIEVSARFVDSKEFRDLYGNNPTNAQFLTKLYENVLGRTPEATGYNWWLNELNTNPSKTKAKVLADFSESGENQTGVASLIGTGITYEPWSG